mgnify:CR=1 FL=1
MESECDGAAERSIYLTFFLSFCVRAVNLRHDQLQPRAPSHNSQLRWWCSSLGERREQLWTARRLQEHFRWLEGGVVGRKVTNRLFRCAEFRWGYYCQAKVAGCLTFSVGCYYFFPNMMSIKYTASIPTLVSLDTRIIRYFVNSNATCSILLVIVQLEFYWLFCSPNYQ